MFGFNAPVLRPAEFVYFHIGEYLKARYQRRVDAFTQSSHGAKSAVYAKTDDGFIAKRLNMHVACLFPKSKLQNHIREFRDISSRINARSIYFINFFRKISYVKAQE